MTANGSQRQNKFPLACFKCGRFLAWFPPVEGLFGSGGSETEREAYGYGTDHKSPSKSWLGFHRLPQGAITPHGPVPSLQCDYGLG